MSKLLFTCFFAGMFLPAFCCINESRVTLFGEKMDFLSIAVVPTGHGFKERAEEYETELIELDSLWWVNHKVDDYSDYGVRLVYLGRYKEAKDVFAQIERLQPGRYATAANIGTVYELLGQNDSALYWLEWAVQIDPTSHYHSEWLHLKILQAKIGGSEKVNAPFLLGTEFGTDSIPVTKLSTEELVKLRDALYFQLNERVSFVVPKDGIVGLLLFELGNITALTDDVTTALRNYDAAIAYGYESEVLDKRYEKFRLMHKGISNEFDKQHEERIKNKAIKSGEKTTYYELGSFVLLLAVLFFWIRKQL